MLDEFKKTKEYQELLGEPVAYFCAEYALFNHSPLYAGGLGILSGDYVMEMIDQNFPTVAVGLFYYRQHVYGKVDSLDVVTPEKLGLELVKNDSEEPHIVTVPIGDRNVLVQAWQWKKGAVTLYLLDTHVSGNHIDDQTITDSLYVENRDMRLKQEMILGIGGMRFLKELGIHPSVYHLNEGHSAFLAFELIRHEMKHRQVDFLKACQYAREHIVFTNHTLEAAGQELYSIDVVKAMASNFAKDLGINVEQLVSLGLQGSSNLFSMTVLALNLSSKVNAVSVLHEKLAEEVWKNYKVEVVTNGIYVKRWDKGLDHAENKRKLLKFIKEKNGVDINENTLLLGWARRFAEYKRPLAILEDVERFKKIAQKEGKEIRLIMSGPLNENYVVENALVKKLFELMNGVLKDLVIFIPNYCIEVAEIMTSGCDVWINTPVVGREACGTSGMKASLNGLLPLTTNDGWIYETDISDIGWVVEGEEIGTVLLDTIEHQIVPMFYDRKGEWETRMKKSRELILEKFSITRALKEYIEKFYVPALAHKKHSNEI